MIHSRENNLRKKKISIGSLLFLTPSRKPLKLCANSKLFHQKKKKCCSVFNHHWWPSFLTSWALFGSSTFCSQFSFSKLCSRNSFSQLKKPLTFAWHQLLVSRVFSPVIFQLKIHRHTNIIYHSRNIKPHPHQPKNNSTPTLQPTWLRDWNASNRRRARKGKKLEVNFSLFKVQEIGITYCGSPMF